ncbi:DNA-binding transcriptional regulator KdgR [Gynuella sp.]|uniref:DNA-binding transcriptional regulator KdgR n=1 Tax=Gynuella sp. TaxID=2969146 RepID=UPI003D150028
MSEESQSVQVEPVSSVMKVFGILSELSETRTIGVTELAQKLMTSKSTVYRFLQTMKMLGFVRQEIETDRYSLTLKLFELSARSLEYVDLIASAERVMRRMSEHTKEAMHLGTRDGESIIYVFKIDSQYNLRMQSTIGGRNPLYSTAIGKVLLANKSESDVRDILANTEFLPWTPKTHRNIDMLLSELEIVREQGFGEDIEEQEEGLRCIATPIFDRFGNAVAGMSISYPTLRHDDEKRERYITMLRENSAIVSKELGWHPA